MVLLHVSQKASPEKRERKALCPRTKGTEPGHTLTEGNKRAENMFSAARVKV